MSTSEAGRGKEDTVNVKQEIFARNLISSQKLLEMEKEIVREVALGG